MKITQLNIKEFCTILKEFRDEISQNMEEWEEEGDHIQVMLNSIDILMKDLKGVNSLDDLNIEKKKLLFPHITFVYNYMNYLTNEDSFEDDFFDDFDDEDYDGEDEDEEIDEDEDEEEEETLGDEVVKKDSPYKSLKLVPKSTGKGECCEGTSCKTTGKPKKK